MGVDIYPMKPARTSGATTKPLPGALAPHNYQLHIAGKDTLMVCSHCGETYRYFLTNNGNSYWVKLDFIGNNLKALDPPVACALPEATQ